MKKILLLCALLSCVTITGCSDGKTSLSGKACLGVNNDTLIEGLNGQCKAGDIVATKHPTYFCDYNYAVAYNLYNSATCVYNEKLRQERIKYEDHQ